MNYTDEEMTALKCIEERECQGLLNTDCGKIVAELLRKAESEIELLADKVEDLKARLREHEGPIK